MNNKQVINQQLLSYLVATSIPTTIAFHRTGSCVKTVNDYDVSQISCPLDDQNHTQYFCNINVLIKIRYNIIFKPKLY